MNTHPTQKTKAGAGPVETLVRCWGWSEEEDGDGWNMGYASREEVYDEAVASTEPGTLVFLAHGRLAEDEEIPPGEDAPWWIVDGPVERVLT